MVLRVKQFGIQRSGTNYIRQLLLDNVVEVHIYEHQFGSKHAVPLGGKGINTWAEKRGRKPLTIEDDVHPIIIIKNPYSWYQSIERFRGSKFSFNAEYARYNKIYKAYKRLYLKGHPVFTDGHIIQYEKLLEDPRKEITIIAEKFGADLYRQFKNPNKVIMSNQFTDDRKKFYLANDNFGLSDDIIDKITQAVDWDVIEFYGYERRG